MNDIVQFGKYRGKTFNYVKNNCNGSYKNYLTNNLNKINSNNKINAEALLNFLNNNIVNLKKYIDKPIFVDNKHDILECPICFENCANLKQTKCGHTFCSICLYNSLISNPLCPICRTVINPRSIMNIPIILKNIINEMICECPYKNNGCNELICYKNLLQHVKSCTFNNHDDIHIYTFFNNINNNRSIRHLYKEFKKFVIDNNVHNSLSFNQFCTFLLDSGYCIYNNKIKFPFVNIDLSYYDIVELFDIYGNINIIN